MQRDPSLESAEVLRVVESGIFERLVRPDQQRPWAVAELVLEIGDRVHVEDAIVSLHASGLLHRSGDFVWATRAALAADSIEL